MTTPSRRPGPESTLEGVRNQLVRAGLDALLANGVELGLGRIKLSDAISDAGVTRATAYRSLADPDLSPQEKLRAEVMSRVLQRGARPGNAAVLRNVGAALLDEFEDQLASDDVAVRTWVLRELIRVTSAAIQDALATSNERSILLAASGAVASQATSAEMESQLGDLRKGEQALLEGFCNAYRGLMPIFGLTLRPGLELMEFATTVAALSEGLVLRSHVNDHTAGAELPTGVDGEMQTWSLQGLGVVGLVRNFFESDPDADREPVVDLQLL